MRLTHGGRSVLTRESLSEFTSAIAMCRCDDKRLTRRLVSEAGIIVPRARLATFDEGDYDVPARKSARSSSNRPAVSRARASPLALSRTSGPEELAAAVARAREQYPEVLIEQRVRAATSGRW